MRLSLDEFSLPKFYLLFGISKVKSAAVTAFRASYRHTSERGLSAASDRERISLTSLETITDALLEILEACMRDIPDCDWLQTWTGLAKSFAFQYNPALQPRAIIVFGCISADQDMKQLLRILVKALESFSDITLIDSIIMCLTRLQPLLRPVSVQGCVSSHYLDLRVLSNYSSVILQESAIHQSLFWVAISVLQLDVPQLYASGLALLEQNLHTLDNQGTFDTIALEKVMMSTREPLEWHFKQLDHSVGLSFKSNFHVALVGHLLKGYRHPAPTTVSRTARVLVTLLAIVAKTARRDKFEVAPDNVAYLAALVAVSEEVRSRCHLKFSLARNMSESSSSDTFPVDLHLNLNPPLPAGGGSGSGVPAVPPNNTSRPPLSLPHSVTAQHCQHQYPGAQAAGLSPLNHLPPSLFSDAVSR
ncbi:hypothetical protein HAZT_HAZT005334, partial [Hyalella azteca]